jgi:hypothetical protein
VTALLSPEGTDPHLLFDVERLMGRSGKNRVSPSPSPLTRRRRGQTLHRSVASE